MLSLLNPYMTYVKLAGVAALLLFAAWAYRVNDLRATHEAQLGKISASLKDAGYKKLGDDDLAGDVDQLAAASATYKQNWANADASVSTQNNSIEQLRDQTAKAQIAGQTAQNQIASTVADRDRWIALAQTASARTTVLPDSQELKQCTAALDSVYSENF